jgi:SAM-dependent methyltransferase
MVKTGAPIPVETVATLQQFHHASMSTGYRFLPLIYDRWQKSYGKDFSSLILPRLLATLKHHRIPTSSMLDLACGTGTLALMMARRGWKVWGVDGSEGMLSEAGKKLRRREVPVTFLRSDIRRFHLPEKVGLVTSFFDSLNHLSSLRDLLQVFRCVHTSLLRGGYLIFDVNNELCFKTVWTRTEAIHHRDFELILRNSYDASRKSACSHVTLFMKKGELYERMCETVNERYFPPEELSILLRQAGFCVLENEDFNFTPDPGIGKIKSWWVARKEGD